MLRLSGNVIEYAVIVCNDDGESSVEFRWRWGIEEIH